MKQFFLSMNLCMLSVCCASAMQSEHEDPCIGSPEQLRSEIAKDWREFNKQTTPEKQKEFLEKKALRLSAKLSRRSAQTSADEKNQKSKK